MQKFQRSQPASGRKCGAGWYVVNLEVVDKVASTTKTLITDALITSDYNLRRTRNRRNCVAGGLRVNLWNASLCSTWSAKSPGNEESCQILIGQFPDITQRP